MANHAPPPAPEPTNEWVSAVLVEERARGLSTDAPMAHIERALERIVPLCLPTLLKAAHPVRGLASVGPEDVVQDVLCKFAGLLGEAEFLQRMIEGKPLSFLRTSIRNRALDVKASQRAHHQAGLRQHAQTPVPPTPLPDDLLAAEEQRVAVHRLLERLNPLDRELVQMRFIEGQSSAEIAARKGMTAPNVRKRISRALSRIDHSDLR
ncbi:MAG: RNA polymerase sigma factor [Bradymonadia bacterium]